MPCSHSAQHIIHEARAHAQTQWISGSLCQRKTWASFQQFLKNPKENATYCRAGAALQRTQQQAINEHPRRWMSAYFKARSFSAFSSHEGGRSSKCWTAEPASVQHPPPIWPSDTVTTGNTSGTDLTATREVCVGAHSGDKDRAASRGCRERSRVTLYWIIWINNRAGCRGSRFH